MTDWPIPDADADFDLLSSDDDETSPWYDAEFDRDHCSPDEHTCMAADVCICGTVALEPHPRCPEHGDSRAWPPRCATCGRFISQLEVETD